MRLKPVGLRDFSLILSMKADYFLCLPGFCGASCSCFHIIRDHHQHYNISRGIDLLFGNNIIIPKSGCICLHSEQANRKTAEFTGSFTGQEQQSPTGCLCMYTKHSRYCSSHMTILCRSFKSVQTKGLVTPPCNKWIYSGICSR